MIDQSLLAILSIILIFTIAISQLVLFLSTSIMFVFNNIISKKMLNPQSSEKNKIVYSLVSPLFVIIAWILSVFSLLISPIMVFVFLPILILLPLAINYGFGKLLGQTKKESLLGSGYSLIDTIAALIVTQMGIILIFILLPISSFNAMTIANPGSVITGIIMIGIPLAIYIFLAFNLKNFYKKSGEYIKSLKTDAKLINLFRKLLVSVVAITLAIGIILFAGIMIYYILNPTHPPDPPNNARDSIINTLSTYKNGGSGSSTPFTLRRGDIISSSDFQDKFDSRSVIFSTSENIENLFEIAGGAEGDDRSQILYIGSTNFPAKVQVYCQVTGQLLAETIDGSGVTVNGPQLPGMCEESTYQPCCLVVIKRA